MGILVPKVKDPSPPPPHSTEEVMPTFTFNEVFTFLAKLGFQFSAAVIHFFRDFLILMVKILSIHTYINIHVTS